MFLKNIKITLQALTQITIAYWGLPQWHPQHSGCTPNLGRFQPHFFVILTKIAAQYI